MTSTATKEAREVAVVTKAELVELREFEEDLAKFKKKASEAEKQVKFRRQAIVEKVLGLQSEAELKVLPLEKVQKLFARRQANGDWELGKGAPVFAFEQTHKGCYPAWKQLFIAELGETAANQIEAETDPTYSYRIEVASPL
jgi:hypothetical protein